MPREENSEKIELWMAKIERKTLTGIPEFVSLMEVQFPEDSHVAEMVRAKGVVCISFKEDVYVYGRSKYAASYFANGFVMAHVVTNLNPVPDRILHTIN